MTFPEGYRYEQIPLDEAHYDKYAKLVKSYAMGFHLAEPSDATIRSSFEDSQKDNIRVSGIYTTPKPNSLDEDYPVGTFLSYPGTINTGRGKLTDASFITYVTVRPTHRRKGLLRCLMTHDLAHAIDNGLPVASLSASEATIYGRYGFGVAIRTQTTKLDTRGGTFALRPDYERSGSVELADQKDLEHVFKQVFAEFHRKTIGSHSHANWNWRLLTQGLGDIFRVTETGKIHTALHYGPADKIDGFISYQVDTTSEGISTVVVHELVGLDAKAEIELLEFAASIDLASFVTLRFFRADHPLRWALVNSRAVQVESDYDWNWIRILNVKESLERRGWDHSGQIVLEVVDPMGITPGRFSIEVADGQAEVKKTTKDADVTLSVDRLANLYLGQVSVFSLAGAGFIQADNDALQRFASLMDTNQLPINLTDF